MPLAEKISLTAEEYLNGGETAEFKHEYQNGEIWAMTGATDNHVTIAGNLFVFLKQYLKRKHGFLTKQLLLARSTNPA